MEDEANIASTNAEVVVSFHYLGRENRGIMIATAFLNILHTTSEVGGMEIDIGADTRPFRETHPLVTEGFIITHADEVRTEHRLREFRAWLDQAVAIGFAEWERQL